MLLGAVLGTLASSLSCSQELQAAVVRLNMHDAICVPVARHSCQERSLRDVAAAAAVCANIFDNAVCVLLSVLPQVMKIAVAPTVMLLDLIFFGNVPAPKVRSLQLHMHTFNEVRCFIVAPTYVSPTTSSCKDLKACVCSRSTAASTAGAAARFQIALVLTPLSAVVSHCHCCCPVSDPAACHLMCCFRSNMVKGSIVHVSPSSLLLRLSPQLCWCA